MTEYFNSVGPVGFESVSNVTATLGVNSPELGTRKTFGSEDYVFVYNAGGEQISLGYGAILSAVTGHSVTVSSVTGVGCIFGIVKHATLTTATYGWLLTRGFCNIKNGMASTALAAGALVGPAADGAFAAHTTSSPVVGHVQQATGSAGTAYAFVKCFGA